LSLSQNSNDSSQADSLTPLDDKISLALRFISPRHAREPSIASKPLHHHQPPTSPPTTTEPGEFKRCNWITKNSGIITFISNSSLFYHFHGSLQFT